jgi:hypothetical protein
MLLLWYGWKVGLVVSLLQSVDLDVHSGGKYKKGICGQIER